MAPQINPIDGELGEILKKTFTSHFRNGYITVDGVCLPDYYQKFADAIENFEVRNDDVWVCSFPKTGTTWTQEMVWCIANDLDFERGKVPLPERFPFLELSSLFDYTDNGHVLELSLPEMTLDSVNFVKNLDSPRFIKTHLPLGLLPRQIRTGEKKPKILYVARNAKDTCISYFHHSTLIEGYRGSFEDFCKLFLGDKIDYAPFWKHVLGFWERRNDDNVLFLRYEDMKADLPAVIEKSAEFLGKKFTNDEIATLAEHLSFASMKANPAVNYEGVVELNKTLKCIEHEGKFMRSGKVDQWKGDMSAETIERFDNWTDENLKNTGLSLMFTDAIENFDDRDDDLRASPKQDLPSISNKTIQSLWARTRRPPDLSILTDRLNFGKTKRNSQLLEEQVTVTVTEVLRIMAHEIKPHTGEVADLLKKTFTDIHRNPTVEIDGFTLPQNLNMDDIDNFEVYDDDVWVCTFPKSGTTWSLETVWCIANDCDFERAKEALFSRFPHLELTSLFNVEEHARRIRPGVTQPAFFLDSIGYSAKQARPRFIKTHLPFQLLPRQIKTGERKPKIICVTRNPKDNCISYFHHCKRVEGFTGTFEEFAKLYLDDAVLYAPFWKHIQGYWERRNEDNFMLITFEDMKKDLPSILRKLGKFLGKNLTDDQVTILNDHLTFSKLKDNRAVNNQENAETYKEEYQRQRQGEFMRSGTTGQWKAVLTPELNQQFDDWTRKNSNGIDISPE
ncbi:uncharacterized protein LOC105685831 [Athalia rosae]|uniref:uncharacterized protein LOC105685831 n=1 Tax=Athalia rosae TaxID=37344 RepID=UPI0020338DCC|nr:uncharacterized protein LOC105685831 [Athalia rosae]